MRAQALSLLLIATFAASGPASAQVATIIRPDPGAVASREIGDSLLDVERIRTAPGVRLITGNAARLPIGGRIEFAATELIAQGSSYCGPGTLYDVLGIPSAGRHLCASAAALDRAGTTFEPATLAIDDPTNFRQQVLYQGRSGSTIRLSYREFAGDLARPAFTQDLTFDIEGDPIVGAKGARLEVLEATNTSITYRLIRPFD